MTKNGFGKRTRIDQYPVKGSGGLGVKTVQLTEARGQLAGALVVHEGDQVMLISTAGTVIRVPAEGIKQSGRATQGVIVMRPREGEQVSTLARVVEQDEAEDGGTGLEPISENGASPEPEPEPEAELEPDEQLEPTTSSAREPRAVRKSCSNRST